MRQTEVKHVTPDEIRTQLYEDYCSDVVAVEFSQASFGEDNLNTDQDHLIDVAKTFCRENNQLCKISGIDSNWFVQQYMAKRGR